MIGAASTSFGQTSKTGDRELVDRGAELLDRASAVPAARSAQVCSRAFAIADVAVDADGAAPADRSRADAETTCRSAGDRCGRP